jgi:hypothetical protein
MKPAVLESFCVGVWGFLAAACISGCATGEGSGPGGDAATSSDDGGGDATAPGSDGGSSRDSGTVGNADARTDATPGADAGGDAVGSDTGSDAEGNSDAGADVGGADVGTDAPAGRDSGVDAEAGSKADASADAADASEAGGPIAGFGTNCPTGTVYSDDFAKDPLTSGNWTTLIGPITYDSPNHLLQLALGNPNTQLWIGARPAWTNYTASTQVRLDSTTVDAGGTGNGGINFRIVDPGPTNPPNDSGKMYFAGINATQVLLGIENTGWTPLAVLPASFTLGTFHTLTVTAKGSTIGVAVDGTTYATVVDTTFATGGIGLRTYLEGASYGATTVTCNP